MEEWQDRIKKVFSLSICCVGFSVFFLSATNSYATKFHSTTYGYNIEIPNGWAEIRSNKIQQLMEIQQPNSGFIYDAGFQPISNKRWPEKPFVLIQVIPYANRGIHRQINEDEFQTVLDGLIGTKGLAVGKPKLEIESRKFIFPIEATLKDGKVRGLVIGHFGHESSVQVIFYYKPPNSNRYANDCTTISDSFYFDPEKAYSVAEAVAHPSHSSIWSGMLEKILTGAILGVLLVFFRRRKKV